jgi:3-hydroxyisobutyrate dehydrogenase-like beta-hydroxyacid dehydrogenase
MQRSFPTHLLNGTQHSAEMRRVGFVGLGFMGRGMAANLAKGLSKLTVFDISQENSKIFHSNVDARKVVFAESLQQIAEESDVICLSLPSESSCQEVIFGRNAIAQTWKLSKERKLIIDHCTSSKAFAQQTHGQLSHVNNLLNYIDSPVSGGPGGARDATLTIMVGGTKQQFEDSLPLFRLIGKKILHFGPAGFIFD